MTGALDTVGSQAHGSRSFPAVGLALQRALLLSLAACVPLLGLYAAAGPVLRALGQQPGVAAAAARYTRLYAARIPLHAVVLCLYRTLASQGARAGVPTRDAETFEACITADAQMAPDQQSAKQPQAPQPSPAGQSAERVSPHMLSKQARQGMCWQAVPPSSPPPHPSTTC